MEGLIQLIWLLLLARGDVVETSVALTEYHIERTITQNLGTHWSVIHYDDQAIGEQALTLEYATQGKLLLVKRVVRFRLVPGPVREILERHAFQAEWPYAYKSKLVSGSSSAPSAQAGSLAKVPLHLLLRDLQSIRLNRHGDLNEVDGERSRILLSAVESAEAASIWQNTPPLLSRQAASVELNQPLVNPRQLGELQLKVIFDDGSPGEWSELVDAGSVLHLPVRRPVQEPMFGIPTDDKNVHPGIRQLIAAHKLRTWTDTERIDSLVGFVYDLLEYEEQSFGLNIEQVLLRRRGDCSEYSELFRQLAIALGVQARTITGLVYDQQTQRFQVHAWNEVLDEGAWRAVDVTWGQSRADITHIPFPEHDVIGTLIQLPSMRFEVLAQQYR